MDYSDDDYYEDDEEGDDIAECDENDETDEESQTFSEEMSDLLAGALLGGAAVVAAASSKRKADRIEQDARHEAIIKEQQFQIQQAKKAWRYKHRVFLCVIRTLVILLILASIGYFEFLKLSPIGYAQSELKGLDYQQAVRMLEESGFGWIIQRNEADLSYSERAEENIVTGIKVGFRDDFKADTQYPSNLPIVITYHTERTIHMPSSSKEITGTDYKDTVQILESAGFGDIELRAKSGFVPGLLNKEGEVLSVSVGGKTKFSSEDSFRVDAKIIIEYFSKEQ